MKMSEEFNVCKAIRMACGGNKEIFIEACGIAEVSREAITMSLKEFEFTEGPKLKIKDGAVTVYKEKFHSLELRFEYHNSDRLIETFVNGISTKVAPLKTVEENTLLEFARKQINEIYADLIGHGHLSAGVGADLRGRSKLALVS